jgi:ATP phosphoribosyltransferase
MQNNSRNTASIAIPKKGRLCADFNKVMEKAGFTFEPTAARRDLGTLSDDNGALPDFRALSARPADALLYVQRGVMDMAVVGLDTLVEFSANAKSACGIDIVATLPISQCAMMIATPVNQRLQSLDELSGMRIATSFPATLQSWLDSKGVQDVEIITLDGGVEESVGLGLADAVCDLVQSGATLAANGLAPNIKLYDSAAVLVRARGQNDAAKSDMLDALTNRIDAAAQGKSPVMAAPKVRTFRFAEPVCMG